MINAIPSTPQPNAGVRSSNPAGANPFSSGKRHAAAGRHRRLSIVQGLRGMGKTKHLKAAGAAVSLLIVSGPARAVSTGPETLERLLHRVAYRPER